MKAIDWRAIDAPRMASLYAEESARWRRRLHWDARATWAIVEPARIAGAVPGFVASDGGDIAGWTFYVRHHGLADVGALVAAETRVADVLLDAFEQDAGPSALAAFVFAPDADLASVLCARGYAVDRFLYLHRTLSPDDDRAAAGVRPWTALDREATARVCAAAYAGDATSRRFALDGRCDQWLEYLDQLTAHDACGTPMPSASLRDDGPGDAAGVLLMTRIADRTAHMAQVAVGPWVQQRGLGARLVEQGLAAARRAGCERVSLLVAESNLRARRLYQSTGFQASAEFLSAWKGLAAAPVGQAAC